MQMFEAFRALNALNEDIFSLDAEGVAKLSDFTQNDDLEDNVQIIDPEAETEDDLQDNYIGKVILDCCVCHSKLYKDKSEVTIDEDGELANVGEECPYCFTPDGFKVIGEVVAFGEKPEENNEEPEEPETEQPEDVEEVAEDDEPEELKTESLREAAFNGGVAGDNSSNGGTVRGRGGSTNGSGSNHKAVDGKKTKKVLAKDIKPGMVTATGKVLTVKNVGDGMEIGYGNIGSRGSYASDHVDYNHQYDVLDEDMNTDRDAGELDPELVNFAKAHKDKLGKIFGATMPLDKISPAFTADLNRSKNARMGTSGGNTLNDIANNAMTQAKKNAAEQAAKKEELHEGIEDLSMTANGTHVDVSEEENGKVTVTMEPVTADGGEMIAPVSPEAEAEIMSDETVEEPVEEFPTTAEPEVDAEFDEFDEEAMDGLGESYFKRVYENVNSFKTTAVKTSGNSMIIEGLLEFESGSKKSTSFVFEALDATKSGKFRFVGDNKELTEGKKAFMLTGTIKDNKLMVESMNYNYKHIDAEGNTSRVYGTERFNKGE